MGTKSVQQIQNHINEKQHHIQIIWFWNENKQYRTRIEFDDMYKSIEDEWA